MALSRFLWFFSGFELGSRVLVAFPVHTSCFVVVIQVKNKSPYANGGTCGSRQSNPADDTAHALINVHRLVMESLPALRTGFLGRQLFSEACGNPEVGGQ